MLPFLLGLHAFLPGLHLGFIIDLQCNMVPSSSAFSSGCALSSGRHQLAVLSCSPISHDGGDRPADIFSHTAGCRSQYPRFSCSIKSNSACPPSTLRVAHHLSISPSQVAYPASAIHTSAIHGTKHPIQWKTPRSLFRSPFSPWAE